MGLHGRRNDLGCDQMLFSRSRVGCQTKKLAAAYKLGAATFPHKKPLEVPMGESNAPAHPEALNVPRLSPSLISYRSKPDIRGKAAILPSARSDIIPDSQLDGESVCGMVVQHLL